MKDRAKTLLRQGLMKVGLKSDNTNKTDKDNPGAYTQILRGAITFQTPFNIIQVGANDGVHGDPIYDFVKEYKSSTNIILVEPVEALIPHLKENYAYHPSAEVVNKAIGKQDFSSIQLYRIKKEYWDNINVDYGEDWPNYRVPTGVTTTNKNRLKKWIINNVQSESSPEEIMETLHVEVMQPNSLIERSQIMNDVHLLQVDTEGVDDEVVYSFLDDGVYPDIINIESKHLTKASKVAYDKKLQEEGYEIYDYTWREKLALRQ